ncbi:MAG: cyclic nucleotide-binding domain-containing protein [Alphaproteobacteria bacterium]|nr:cyclic nucleotide-binding domain-containing protein [Alphaproteobacteria bacterium]
MADNVAVAIIGSGPAGLSAAGHAAEAGLSHVLLEKMPHASDTIFKYQKGKYVMATPDILPLRSPFRFQAGAREEVLGAWDEDLAKHKVNVRYKAEVTRVKGKKGAFEISLTDGSKLTAENVILSIGLQGNLRKLDCPGAADAPHVQYQLDDPDEYEGETVVVIGAGDAAIENAVALSKQNTVLIVNRRDEFARAKQGNLDAVTAAIEKGVIQGYFNTAPVKVTPGTITLRTPEGEAEIKCDRIIARLGAIPPRQFVESCGVKFPNDNPASLPEVSRHYESNVEGLYIIGALGGYPLIKQAMNQGYEVIEFIRGNRELKPADEPLLEEKIKILPGVSVDAFLKRVRDNVPLFRELNTLLLRELMLDSEVRTPKPGEAIFTRNDYSNTFYTIVDGQVAIEVNPNDPTEVVLLGKGEFFGEMGLISGRRRTATIKAHSDCVLLETNRRSMIKLINSVEEVRRVMDQTAIARQIQTYLAPRLAKDDLADVLASAQAQHFMEGETLFNEGEIGDSVHLIRRGSVTVSRRIGGRDIVLSYVAAGNYVGEMALLSDAPRSATVRAAINHTETIRIEGQAFKRLMSRSEALRKEVEQKFGDRIQQNERMANAPEVGSIIQFLVDQGASEATDILLIDEALCVRCDNCEKACAESHDGISRLNREAGPTFANVHVPTSCRHCEHPHCMTDCPPDAIHRRPNGEVFIDDSCIGCGNCQRNCPYGVIQLAVRPPGKPSILNWLLFGAGPGPGQDKSAHPHGQKKAVKCDMCSGIEGGPACVRGCPTGAAIRVNPERFLSLATLGQR